MTKNSEKMTKKQRKTPLFELLRNLTAATWDDVDGVEYVPAKLRNVPPFVFGFCAVIVAFAVLFGVIMAAR